MEMRDSVEIETPYSGTGTGTSNTNYGAYNRLYTNKAPTFKCTDKDNDLYTTPGSSEGNGALIVNNSNDENYRDETPTPIGLITADEVAFAGGVSGSINTSNTSYYLNNNAYYWDHVSARLASDAYVFIVNSSGKLHDYGGVNNTWGVRPVINLKSAIAISGSGTTSDPFKVGSD